MEQPSSVAASSAKCSADHNVTHNSGDLGDDYPGPFMEKPSSAVLGVTNCAVASSCGVDGAGRNEEMDDSMLQDMPLALAELEPFLASPLHGDRRIVLKIPAKLYLEAKVKGSEAFSIKRSKQYGMLHTLMDHQSELLVRLSGMYGVRWDRDSTELTRRTGTATSGADPMGRDARLYCKEYFEQILLELCQYCEADFDKVFDYFWDNED